MSRNSSIGFFGAWKAIDPEIHNQCLSRSQRSSELL